MVTSAAPLAFVMYAGVALLAAAGEPARPDYEFIGNGAYFIDHRSGLAWTRCPEGMDWDGKRCTGIALLLNHAQATNLAATRSKTDTLHWRLPRLTELQRLAGRAAKVPELNSTIFPAAAQGAFWTATSSVKAAPVNQYNYSNIERGRTSENAVQVEFLNAWSVDPQTGEARSDILKRTRLLVRLVASPE